MNRSDNNFGLYIYFEHSATCESNININSKNKKKSYSNKIYYSNKRIELYELNNK